MMFLGACVVAASYIQVNVHCIVELDGCVTANIESHQDFLSDRLFSFFAVFFSFFTVCRCFFVCFWLRFWFWFLLLFLLWSDIKNET